MDAHGLIQKVELVEVHGDHLLFGVLPFDAHGDHPFLELLHRSFQELIRAFVEQHFRQLLRERAAASIRSALEYCACQCTEVDTAVFKVAFVLCGHQCIDQMGGKLIELHMHSVFAVVFADDLSVGRIDRARLIAHRVFDLLETGQRTKGTEGCSTDHQCYGEQSKENEQPKSPHIRPEVRSFFCFFSLLFLCH